MRQLYYHPVVTCNVSYVMCCPDAMYLCVLQCNVCVVLPQRDVLCNAMCFVTRWVLQHDVCNVVSRRAVLMQ